MKAKRSSKFFQIGPPTTELGALERLKISPYTYNGENGVATFYRTLTYLQVTMTYIRTSMSS